MSVTETLKQTRRNKLGDLTLILSARRHRCPRCPKNFFFSTTVHVSPAGIPHSRISAWESARRVLDLDPPPPCCLTPPHLLLLLLPRPPAAPWLPSHSRTARPRLAASLVATGRDISVLSLKRLLPHLLTVPPPPPTRPSSASHSPAPSICRRNSTSHLRTNWVFCFSLCSPGTRRPCASLFPSLCFHSTISLLHFSPRGP